jgi:hypothetical protein
MRPHWIPASSSRRKCGCRICALSRRPAHAAALAPTLVGWRRPDVARAGLRRLIKRPEAAAHVSAAEQNFHGHRYPHSDCHTHADGYCHRQANNSFAPTSGTNRRRARSEGVVAIVILLLGLLEPCLVAQMVTYLLPWLFDGVDRC